MSARLPPQVELMRDETMKTLSGSRRDPAFEAKPQTCVFLPNAKMSGSTPKSSKAHIVPVRPTPVCTSSKMRSMSCSSQSVAQLAQELGAEVVVAALALDRLDDEGGDVVAVVDEGLLDLRERERLAFGDVALEAPRRRPGSGASG